MGRDGVGRDGVGRDGVGRDGVGRDGVWRRHGALKPRLQRNEEARWEGQKRKRSQTTRPKESAGGEGGGRGSPSKQSHHRPPVSPSGSLIRATKYILRTKKEMYSESSGWSSETEPMKGSLRIQGLSRRIWRHSSSSIAQPPRSRQLPIARGVKAAGHYVGNKQITSFPSVCKNRQKT